MQVDRVMGSGVEEGEKRGHGERYTCPAQRTPRRAESLHTIGSSFQDRGPDDARIPLEPIGILGGGSNPQGGGRKRP